MSAKDAIWCGSVNNIVIDTSIELSIRTINSSNLFLFVFFSKIDGCLVYSMSMTSAAGHRLDTDILGKCTPLPATGDGCCSIGATAEQVYMCNDQCGPHIISLLDKREW